MKNTVMVEIAATVLTVAYVIYFYMQMSVEDVKSPFTYTWKKLAEEFNEPRNIIYMAFYLILIYGIIYLAGLNRTSKYPHSIRLLEYKTWIFMFILVGVQVYTKFILPLSF